MKSNEGSFTDVFQGCRFLIWTLIKISYLKIGSINIKLFYAEGQNNTYKC